MCNHLPLLRLAPDCRLTPLVAALGLAAAVAAPVGADDWVDTHDSPAPAWELTDPSPARLVAHERLRLQPKGQATDVGAERIAYAAPPGTTAWVLRPTPAAVVIDELSVHVEATNTLPGTILAVEVALPRTAEGSTSDAVVLRLSSDPARWSPRGVMRIGLTDLPRRLQRRARAWRLANPGKPLDTREAYVTRAVLGLPGSGRPEQAMVRELRLEGYVPRPQSAGLANDTPPIEGPLLSSPAAQPLADAAPGLQGGTLRLTEVRLGSDGFRIDGEPYYPRVWRWRGEPFEELARRGVNTVWLDEAPTPQRLAEAAHYRLRLFCPPPKTRGDAESVASWDRVLAWVLPGAVDGSDLDTAMAVVERTRALPPAAQRPILAHAVADSERWARVVDGLLLDADGSRASGPPNAARRLAERSASLGPGTPVLAVVPLDVGRELIAQLDALLGDGVVSAWLPAGDVARSVDAALGTDVAGVVFVANEGLDGADDATSVAAGWLETINRRLRLIEPWLVNGRSEGVAGVEGASTRLLTHGGVKLAALPAMPSTGAPTPTPFSGLSDSARVYRLNAAGLHGWAPPPERPGDLALRPPGDLLACHDPRVVRSLRAYTRRGAGAAAATLIEVATAQLANTEALSPADRRRAARALNDAKLASARRDFAAAYDAAHLTVALVASAEDRRREIAIAGATLESTPLTVLPRTLTDHFRMSQLLASSPRGANRLHGGSFEDIDELRRHGWRHPAAGARADAPNGPPDDDHTPVGLVEANAVHGERVLRLRGSKPGEWGPRIRSPEIDLASGETLELTGWARVEAPTPGDRLEVVDTLGGEELALSIGSTDGEWRPFRLLRRASAQVGLGLEFRARGDVTAEIDAVMARPVEPTGPARTASRGSTQPK